MKTRSGVHTVDLAQADDGADLLLQALPGMPYGTILPTAAAVGTAAPSATASSATASSPSNASPSPKSTGAAFALPSWIAKLGDTAIRADMAAAAAGGTVSQSGMATLFGAVAMELSATNMTLSSSQMADLKTIAADLNVGETASAYVTYTTDAVILGTSADILTYNSPANASWTGGGTSAVALGNLAVGSTATQLSELNGKWFLGTDLPASDYGANLTYSADNAPLYVNGSPSPTDINQGQIGDCFLLSTLEEVAYQNPSIIESMITPNGNNTYGVRFYVPVSSAYGAPVSPVYVTVSNKLADGGSLFNQGPAIWGSLVEQAYAELVGDSLGQSANGFYGAWNFIAEGGGDTTSLLTGCTNETFYQSTGTSWSASDYFETLASPSEAQLLPTLASDLAVGDDVTLASLSDATDANGKTTLVSRHDMAIYGYDSATGELEVRNPWGTAPGQTWDTTFEVRLSDLQSAAGDWIIVDNVGHRNPMNVPVSEACAMQGNSQVEAFTVSDTAANVQASLGSLGGDGKLQSITLTGSGTASISLSYAAYVAAAAVLAKISSPYAVTVSGIPASAAAAVQASANVASFTISDTTANVQANLVSLANDSKLKSISLTNTGTASISLTYTAYVASGSTLLKVSSPYALSVSGVPVSAAAAVQANAKVSAFTISDTSANVQANLASLANDSKLGVIILTDAGTGAISLTYTAYVAAGSTLAKISSPCAISVSGAPASAAAALQANARVSAFTISDTAANVQTNLASLVNDSKLQSVSGAPVSAATSLQGTPNVASFSITDSSANVFYALYQLAHDSKVTSITLTDPNQTGCSTAIVASALPDYMPALSKFTTQPNLLTVCGAQVGQAAALQACVGVSAFTVSDTLANVQANLGALGADSKLLQIAVSNAGVAAAPSMQANRLVSAFSVIDAAAGVSAAAAALNADTKLMGVTVTGTGGGDTLKLTGTSFAASINLGGDTASVAAWLPAQNLTFIGSPDAVTLGSGRSIVSYAMSGGGVETIANFQLGVDELILSGASSAAGLKLADTTFGGVHAVDIYAAGSPSTGVFLTGFESSVVAALLQSPHLQPVAGGIAIL